MPELDIYLFFAAQGLLVLVATFAVLQDMRLRLLSRIAEAEAEVRRSDKSFGSLYVAFAAVVAAYAFLGTQLPGLDGKRIAFVILDFLCAAYVFIFSSWFRNAVFFPLMRRVRLD